MDHLKRNLRFALRSLARRPSFTAVAVIILRRGIGANSAVFLRDVAGGDEGAGFANHWGRGRELRSRSG